MDVLLDYTQGGAEPGNWYGMLLRSQPPFEICLAFAPKLEETFSLALGQIDLHAILGKTSGDDFHDAWDKLPHLEKGSS